MAIGYTAIEEAVRQRIVTVFSEELNDARCKAGDVDGVIRAMFEENSPYGVFLDFGRGVTDPDSPFNTQIWTWTVVGVFLIHYTGLETEQNLRSIVDKFPSLLAPPYHALGGSSALAKVIFLGDPEPGQVGDIPFYWLPFTVSAIDR